MNGAYEQLLDSVEENSGEYASVIFLDIDGVLNDFDDRRLQCLRFFVHLPQICITEILRKR